MNNPGNDNLVWEEQYESKPYLYPGPDGIITGSLALTAGKTTILPRNPETLYTSDGRTVNDWKRSLISVDGRSIIAQLSYHQALECLAPFIIQQRENAVLVRELAENEMRMLADKEENDPHVEPVVFTNMCMICDGDNILVQDRLEKSWYGITFPGGHVRPGESFAAAVIREVYEETGLTIDNVRLCGMKHWIHPEHKRRYIVLLYKTDTFSGELKSSDEGAVLWIDRRNVEQYDLAEGFREILSIYENSDADEIYMHFEDDSWKTDYL